MFAPLPLWWSHDGPWWQEARMFDKVLRLVHAAFVTPAFFAAVGFAVAEGEEAAVAAAVSTGEAASQAETGRQNC